MRKNYRHSSDRLREIAEFFLERAERKELKSDDAFRDRLSALNKCLERLQPQSRDLIDMHYRRRVTVRAIGDQLGLKEKTVSKAICRIRETLKKCIEALVR